MTARPTEPTSGAVWHRGWEVSYEPERARWTGEGWTAYKGGCDLDVPCVTAASFEGCLNFVDDEEDEQ